MSERDRAVLRESLRAALRHDPVDEAAQDAPPEERPRSRVGLVIVLSFLCIAGVASGLVAVSFAQVTSRSVALAAHERMLAVLTEIDALIAIRTPDVQAQLDAGAERVTLPDFAIRGASVVRGDAATPDGVLDAARFRAALLSESALLAYEGSGAPGEGGAAASVLGTPRALLTATWHARALLAGAIATLGVACTAALLLLAARRRGWIALGTAVAAAGVCVTVLAGVTSVALGAPGESTAGSLRSEELAVARALLDVPFRNGVLATCLGAVIAAIGVVRAAARPRAQRTG